MTHIKKVKYAKVIKKTDDDDMNHIRKVTLMFLLSSDPTQFIIYLFLVYVTVQ